MLLALHQEAVVATLILLLVEIIVMEDGQVTVVNILMLQTLFLILKAVLVNGIM